MSDDNYNRLVSLIADIVNLRNFPPDSSTFKAWQASVERHLKKTWPDDESFLNQFNRITYGNQFVSVSTREYGFEAQKRRENIKEYYQKGLRDAEAILKSFLSEVPRNTISEIKNNPIKNEIGKNVFIVHGHDNELLLIVKDTLNTLGLNPIILHEQPNQNKTVIEKLETHSDEVDFAVILLTPDDEGYPKGKENQKRFRARQNVVLELGFFQGLLGRENVAVLHKEDVEIPSDYAGIVYISMNNEWKLKLALEMKTAGLDVDLNKLAKPQKTNNS